MHCLGSIFYTLQFMGIQKIPGDCVTIRRTERRMDTQTPSPEVGTLDVTLLPTINGLVGVAALE